jgi:hypothetical protein
MRFMGLGITQNEITRALSAAPPDVAQAATVAKMDSQGKIIKDSSAGIKRLYLFAKEIGQPAMCEDRASMQWFSDFLQHKPKPTNTVPGIIYMLAGATQRSDSNPYDKTIPSITVGP